MSRRAESQNAGEDCGLEWFGEDGELLEAALCAESLNPSADVEGASPTAPGRNVVAVFDVDGCAVAFTLALLTDQVSAGAVYVISYCQEHTDLATNTIGDADSVEFMPPCEDAAQIATPTRVRFCLLNQSPPCVEGSERSKDRVRAAFVCDFPARGPDAEALRSTLLSGEALSTETLKRTLNHALTFAIHDEFNTVLAAMYGNSRGPPSKRQKTTTGASATSMRHEAETFPRGKRGLTALYVRFEQRTIAAYRRLYGGSATTAFWYVSKFGPDEKTLVLCTRYYLLQAQNNSECSDYDLQAIKDLCLTYNVPVPPNASGLSLQDLTSFAKLSKFCCASGYASGPPSRWFPDYVAARVAADTAEVHALKGFIERDRGGLRISDGEFVKYVYLAHFECYNREQLRRHLDAVSAKTVGESVAGRSKLGAVAIEGFFTHVRSQLNIADYIATSVEPQITELSAALARAHAEARTYDPAAVTIGSKTVAMWGSSANVAKKIDSVEEALAKRGWPKTAEGPEIRHSHPPPILDSHPTGEQNSPTCRLASPTGRTYGPLIVRRLLAISASDPPPNAPSVAASMVGIKAATGPLPVYRTAITKGRQLFGISAADQWEPCVSRLAQIDRHIEGAWDSTLSASDEPAKRDAALTAKLSSAPPCRPPPVLAGPERQKDVNRNELFNDNLAVGTLILDVDMRVRGPVPYVALHEAMRGFRTGALTALRLLMPSATVDWARHPCYFYKSECPREGRPGVSAQTSETPDSEMFDFPEHPPTDEGWEAAYAHASSGIDAADEFIDFCDVDCWPDPPMYSEGNPPPRASGEDETIDPYPTACSCKDKIGMRVCIPIPAPYAIQGAKTVHGIARVVQQAVLLERSFVESAGPYLRDYDLIDTGVYGHGRSLRMPFFGKIEPSGAESRTLLPFYVVPEDCECVPDFVRAHFDPTSFHTHVLRDGNPAPRLILRGLGGDYISFFDRKNEMNRAAFFKPRLSLAAELDKRGVDINDPTALENFVSEAVLGDIGSYVSAHFPDHAAEYKNVSASCVAVKGDWALLQIIPRGSVTSRRSFSCVRYKHRRPAGDTVRTYLSISVDAHGRLCASIGQQCFAAKCGNNKLRTLFTVDVAER